MFYDFEEYKVFEIIAFCVLPNIGVFVDRYLCADELRSKDGKPTWYDKLVKPSFCLPAWTFGIIWMILFTSIGYASYLVYWDGDGFDGIAFKPLLMYAGQLVMNWMWTPVFFLRKDLKTSFLMVVILTITGLITGVNFYLVNSCAGYIFIPYVLWLTYADIINYSFWKLNPDPVDYKQMETSVDV